ncbi:hypothetical protein PDO_4050 [Rhizobium sp. PDO1-076]|nr:hypothetical protein PDO_4050 [Rhizobium sp. PDO1-076]
MAYDWNGALTRRRNRMRLIALSVLGLAVLAAPVLAWA